jgi:AraC family transcriptional regulator, regulatory protein of adaptative response / methylated-DNA-[protein]-cysteine methyltransferase
MTVMAAPRRARTRRPQSATPVRFAIVPSALGFIAVARTANGLAAAFLGDDEHELVGHMRRRFVDPVRAEPDELAHRVARSIDSGVDDPAIPLDPAGTEFQKAVWRALREIPAGATVTYGEIARRIGRPDSVRAVGAACGANPIAVIVPCHRVVGKDGSLTGYEWGIEKKRMLLEREKARTA